MTHFLDSRTFLNFSFCSVRRGWRAKEWMHTAALYKLKRLLFNYGPLHHLFPIQRIHSRPSNCCGCRQTLSYIATIRGQKNTVGSLIFMQLYYIRLLTCMYCLSVLLLNLQIKFETVKVHVWWFSSHFT